MHIGIASTQVHYSRVFRAVSILRVRQRRGERVPYAFRNRALDRAKRKWRVRVQSLDLISCECNYIVILPPNPCIRLGRQSLIPIAFGLSSTLGYTVVSEMQRKIGNHDAAAPNSLQTRLSLMRTNSGTSALAQAAARLKIMRSAVRTREERRNAISRGRLSLRRRVSTMAWSGTVSMTTHVLPFPTGNRESFIITDCPCSTVGGLSVVRFPATVTLSAVQISVTRPSQLVTHDFNDDTGADTTSVCCMISAKPFYTAIHSAIFTVHTT
jgi:hypothetical protein